MLFFMISCLLLKTAYGHSNKRDQNHGRSNKLPIKIIIFFSLSVLLTYSVNRSSLGGDPESLGAKIDLPITLLTKDLRVVHFE